MDEPSIQANTREEAIDLALGFARENRLLKAENHWLKEQFHLLRHLKFGASSEQISPEQQALIFNELEVLADPLAAEPTAETATRRRTKAKGHREAQFADLEIVEIPYRLSEDEMICPNCAGRSKRWAKKFARSSTLFRRMCEPSITTVTNIPAAIASGRRCPIP